MKAAVVHAYDRPLSIEDVPVPEPGPEQVLVRIEASGLCHTDIHAARGEWPVKPPLPFIPGHEGVGIVERVGPGVDRVAVGDRVGIAAALLGLPAQFEAERARAAPGVEPALHAPERDHDSLPRAACADDLGT